MVYCFLGCGFVGEGGGDLGFLMASRQGTRHRKGSSAGGKTVNSPSSSTTSSSRQVMEVASVDEQSSPASSSAQYFCADGIGLDADPCKENVSVTVRFRPLRYCAFCVFDFVFGWIDWNVV